MEGVIFAVMMLCKIKQFVLMFLHKSSSEDHLQFVYKYIDPTDWEKPFVFTVAISEEGKYNGKLQCFFINSRIKVANSCCFL